MRVAPAVVLSKSDREWLLKQSRSSIAPNRLGDRCRIVLLAAEGKTNEQIGEELEITDKKAGRWRMRFVQKGRSGLEKDEPGRGRKLTYPKDLRDMILEKTTRSTPADATQWSRTSMAEAMDMSASTVGRIWRGNGLRGAGSARSVIPVQFPLNCTPNPSFELYHLVTEGGAIGLRFDPRRGRRSRIAATQWRTNPSAPLESCTFPLRWTPQGSVWSKRMMQKSG